MKNQVLKSGIRTAVLLLTAVIALTASVVPASADDKASSLRFGADGEFTVLQITDPIGTIYLNSNAVCDGYEDNTYCPWLAYHFTENDTPTYTTLEFSGNEMAIENLLRR